MNKREPCNGLQGEGSLGSYCRREDSRRIGAAVRGPSEPDHDLEAASHRSAAGVFGKSSSRDQGADVEAPHPKIGQLTIENDFLESALTKAERMSVKR